MTSNVSAEAASKLTGIPKEKQKSVLSSLRLKVTLIAMIVTIVAVLAGLIYILVEQIFGQLTPRIHEDLLWKAERGAAELSYTTELGILTRDESAIRTAAKRYLSDSDVMGIIATDQKGKVLFSHGTPFLDPKELFTWSSGKSIEHPGFIAAWMPSEIEGTQIGRVAVAVSTKRLQAGNELRNTILLVAFFGSLAALLSALFFINLHIVPLLRVTEAAFRELELKTEAALEASRLKSQFLANMSHEIRTPLNGIVGLVGLMMDMEIDSLLYRYVQMVDVSVRGLIGIVSDILDFSKIEAGKLELRKRRFEPRIVSQEVAELNSERAHSKGLEILCSVSREVPKSFVTDPERFRQVLTNLVGNAIKFTETGEVLIRLTKATDSARGEMLRVEVVDTGIGIKESDKNKLFETFSQVDGSSVRNYGGTGLGLAISKQLIHALGGEIGVDSQPGLGSTFWFTVPIIDPIEDTGTVDEPQSIDPKGKRALVVDANEHARTIIKEHLIGWGMQCSELASGLEALDLLQANFETKDAFGVVILAAQTLDITGEEFIELARADLDLKNIPLVLLRQRSQSVSQEQISDALTAEVNKPVRSSELFDAIVGTLFGKRAWLPKQKTIEESANGSFGDKVILVVDDNEVNLFVAAETVERQGYHVAVAKNGEEAVQAVLTKNVAMVLMDCQMPVMDGYEATRQIRLREPADKKTPIIALTAHALLGERDKCMKAGMDDYLTKPIRPEYLKMLLRQYMSSDEQARAKRSSMRTMSERHRVDRAASGDEQTGGEQTGAEPMSIRTMAQTQKADRGTNQRISLTDAVTSDAVATVQPIDDPKLLLSESSRSKRLIELFLGSTPPLIDELENAIIAKDHEQTRAKAHKLKGSCLAVEAPSMAAIATKLQKAAEKRDLRTAQDDLEQIRGLLGRVQQLLNDELIALSQ